MFGFGGVEAFLEGRGLGAAILINLRVAQLNGDLGLFGKGMMVPEFEKCVMAIKPGEISPVCATSFGYHVIYRSPYADVAEKFAPIAKQRNVQIAESTYLAKVESSNGVELTSGVAVKAKAIARNPLGYAKDNDKLKATGLSLGGVLLPGTDLDKVASLPTRDQALSMLMGVMKAPIQKLVGTLAASPSKLVRTLAAVRDQKQASA